MRLRLWLLALDVVDAVERVVPRACKRTRRRLRAVYLWTVGKASDATDWGPGAECGEERPW